MTWLGKITPEDATGDLADLYQKISSARGGVAEVHQVQSLNLRAMKAHMELYKSIVFQRSSISRAQRERLGVAVSATNDCNYCVAHHTEPLRRMGDSDETLAALGAGEVPTALDELDRELIAWAIEATREPGRGTDEARVARLKALGMDDRGVLDAVLTIAYFNFVNRLVLMTGARLEPDFAETCR